MRKMETRTIRDLWYSVVKPFLSRVEPASEVLKPKWTRYRSQTLSAVLSEMVLSGLCSYKHFMIEDRTRPKRRPSHWNKLKVGRFDEVILFIEKDASFPKIEGLAGLLGFTVECGKGQQATTAISEMIENLDHSRSYLVFTLTDYDYYGHLIMDSFEERASVLGLDAEFVRVGVNIDQVPPKRRQVAKFRLPLSSRQEREWAEIYAIDGEYGLEIEALTPPEIRGTIADAVYEYCDPEALYEYLRDAALEGMSEKILSDLVDWGEESDPDLIALRDKIEELENELEQARADLNERFSELAERVVDENMEDEDDRPDFPEMWLKRQIVSGNTTLNTGKYTSNYGIRTRLFEIAKGECE